MNQKLDEKKIVDIIVHEFSSCQAIYLFGSYADYKNNANSDVDIAILLPHEDAKKNENLTFGDLHQKLIDELKQDVDLINLRLVATVFQKEIISKGRIIFCSNLYAKDEFEMLTLSLYQELNEERKEILEDLYDKRN